MKRFATLALMSMFVVTAAGCGSSSQTPVADNGVDEGNPPEDTIDASATDNNNPRDTAGTDTTFPDQGLDNQEPDGADAIDDPGTGTDGDSAAADQGDEGGDHSSGDDAEDGGIDPGKDEGTDTNVKPSCDVNNGGCHQNARCHDTVDGVECRCLTGYDGNGYDCTDINECNGSGATACDTNATCHNLPGSFECVCNDGYQGSGASCSDINECAALISACAIDAWCTNEPGYFTCQCMKGSTMQGNECRWAFQIEASGRDSAAGVVVDRWASTYVLASFEGFAAAAPSNGGTDIGIVKYDYEGKYEWTRTFGAFANDSPGGITVDVNGNVYAAGTVGGAVDGQTFSGWMDVIVTKYDKSGVHQWTRLLGTEAYDSAVSIVQYGDSVYVAGYTSGTIPDQTSAGGVDAFVSRIDLDGNLRWVTQFGSAAADRATGVAVSGVGLVYVTGTTEGSMESGVEPGFVDVFLTALDTAGVVQWTRQTGSFGYDEPTGIGIDSSYRVWVAGTTSAQWPGQPAGGYSDGFVVVTASDGTPDFTMQFGTPDAELVSGIIVDDEGAWLSGTILAQDGAPNPDGNQASLFHVSSLGYLDRSVPFGSTQDDWGRGIARSTYDGFFRLCLDTLGDIIGKSHSGDTDMGLAVIDVQNGAVWTRQKDSKVAVSAGHSRLADEDALYITGGTRGHIAGTDLTNQGDVDAFVAKVYSTGQVAWVRSHGTGYNDMPGGVAVGPDSVTLVGYSPGYVDGSASERETEIFLSSWDLDGNVLSRVSWGSEKTDRAYDAVADADGNIFVVGTTYGDLEGLSSGSADAFVAMFDKNLSPVWVHQFGSSKIDELRAVALHPDGGVVATGRALDFVSGASSAGTQIESGGVIAVRYELDGTRSWLRLVGSEFSDVGNGIDVNGEGDVFISGTVYGLLDGTAGFGNTDVFVMKLSGVDGHALWGRQWGTTGADEGRKVSVAPDGSVYLTGEVTDLLSNTDISSAPLGGREAFVMKVADDGSSSVSWLISSALDESGYGIIVDSMGNVIATGTTTGAVDEKSPGGIESLYVIKR